MTLVELDVKKRELELKMTQLLTEFMKETEIVGINNIWVNDECTGGRFRVRISLKL